MATLSHILFKHGNLVLQVWNEPQMRGVWEGALISHHTHAEEVTRLAASLKFNTPYFVGSSVRSIFEIGSREPLVIIDEVAQKMRQEIPDFSDMPDDLWFSVPQSSTIAIGWWTAEELSMSRVIPQRGPQTGLVTRVFALKEVKDATDLQDGMVVVTPKGVIGDAKAMLEIGQKLAETYEREN